MPGGKPFGQVLIIGAGSGNDVSRALAWGAERVDAVEIDPVIQRIGKRDHPDRPYDDPRVFVHLNDGRNYLKSGNKQYDLIVYALVDSLVLHSGYSNIRLESYLFTKQAMDDVRKRLRPGGVFVMYNYFRQGWIVSRLQNSVRAAFGEEALVLNLPSRDRLNPDDNLGGDFTMLIAGANSAIRDAFARQPEYWLRLRGPFDHGTPNGFDSPLTEIERTGWRALAAEERDQSQWQQFRLTQVNCRRRRQSARHRRLADALPARADDSGVSLRGGAIMAVIAALLLAPFLRRRVQRGRRGEPATRAAAADVLPRRRLHAGRDQGGGPHGAALRRHVDRQLGRDLRRAGDDPDREPVRGDGAAGAAGAATTRCCCSSLVVSALVPMDTFLGMDRTAQITAASVLAFTPIFFAGVVFAVSFMRGRRSPIAPSAPTSPARCLAALPNTARCCSAFSTCCSSPSRSTSSRSSAIRRP